MSLNEDLKVSPEIVNAINLLIVKGYLLAAPDVGVLSISGPLNRFYKANMSNLQEVQTTAINRPEEKITIQDFKEKAEIPFRIKTATFNYTVSSISREAEKYFNSTVIGKVDMNLLIELTKAFYKDESVARPTLSNYFLNGIWQGVLKEYKPKNSIPLTNQSFTGDRKL